MRLNTSEFFKYFILHPDSNLLDNKEDRVTALISSIAIGIFTLGLCHLICALAFRSYKPRPPGSTTPESEIFEKTYPPVLPPSSGQVTDPIPKRPSTDHFDRIQQQFWSTYYDPAHPELFLFFQKAFFKALEDAGEGVVNFWELAKALVTRYLEYKGQEPDEQEHIKLYTAIALNLEHWKPKLREKEQPPEMPKTEISPDMIVEIAGEESCLAIFRTTGDGSCGFYALMGVPIKGAFDLPNIRRTREEFCQFLRDKRSAGELPNEIETILIDHFVEFAHAPSAFQKATRVIRERLYKDYKTLSKDEQDARKAAFLADNDVFEAYLSHLAKPGTYLLQTELVAVAMWQNLAIRLFQPEWGEGRELIVYKLINEGEDRPIVDIYYNGHNHYARGAYLQ